KAILSSILGLEIWDTYKERTAEKRKAIENEVNSIDGRIAEIDAELAEEETRKTRLSELETNLKQLTSARAAQEKILENIKNTTTILTDQRKLVESLVMSLEKLRSSLLNVESKLVEEKTEQANYADLVNRAKEIESAYKNWQKTRKELEEWEKTAMQFREHDEKRQPLLREIEVEKVKLEQESIELSKQLSVISEQLLVIGNLEAEINSAKKSLAEVELDIKKRDSVESQRNEARERHAGLKVENVSLRSEMDELKNRIDALKVADGAECPLCGQPLSEEHRKSTLKGLEKEGKLKGDVFRANKKEIEEIEKQIADYELQISKFTNVENDRLRFSNLISQLTLQVDSVNAQNKEWEKTGAKRLKEINKLIESKRFAPEAQKELTKLDKELAKLGYDISAHEAKRREEFELREVEEEYRKLDSAREVSKRIENKSKS
ncbi:MAG: hypothetical protein HC797_04340, partial [Anaerolineales bacterium]|nr:hypothetical protein [Anaerolineales bacterium]